MRFSIIVPVYNVELYIDRCLESIVSQDFSDYEVLLIDDGSTDSSSNICDKYAAMHNNFLVFHKENGGVSSARNLGLLSAKGEYIIFIDPDDYIEKNSLFLIDKEILANKSDLIIYGTAKHIIQDGTEKMVNNYDYNESVIINTGHNLGWKKYILSKRLIFNVCSEAFKRSIIKDNSIVFPPIKNGEDAFFSFNYLNYVNKISIIPYTLYHYMHIIGDSSATQRYYPEYINERNQVLSQALKFINFDKQLSVYLYNDYVNLLHYFIIKTLFHKDNKMNLLEKRHFVKKLMNSKEVKEAIKFSIKKKMNMVYKIGRISPTTLIIIYKILKITNKYTNY